MIVQITHAVRSTERLSSMTDILTNLQQENSNLRRQLSRVQTPQFIEAQARDKLGLAKKGETIIIIPDEKIKQVLGTTTSGTVNKLPNWLGWWKVFFP